MKARALRWLAWLALAGEIALAGRGWVGVDSRALHAGLLLCAVGVAGLSVRTARSGRYTAVLLLNALVSLLVGAFDLVWPWCERSDEDGPASYPFVEAHGDPAGLRPLARALRPRAETDWPQHECPTRAA